MMSKTWKIAGINFDHMHMGDLLRLVHEHPDAEIVGICDGETHRMQSVIDTFRIPSERVFTDYEQCIQNTKPDIVILCPSTAEHAKWVEKIVPYNVNIIIEKPFAANLGDADRMIAAMKRSEKQLLVNWPLRWYPTHATTHRLVSEGGIGNLLDIHYYDGNRGPLRHGADKVELEPGPKSQSWFYQKAAGGGSLLDYLGYGVTLGTWFFGDSKKPIEVTSVVDQPRGFEVDEHSVTVVRYDTGISTFETQWGTFTDPWCHQPQPKCGFVLKGDRGTISSYDFEESVFLQTEAFPEGKHQPVDKLETPFNNCVSYFIHCLENDLAVEGPLSPGVCRIGQQIVDTAYKSAQVKQTLSLLE